MPLINLVNLSYQITAYDQLNPLQKTYKKSFLYFFYCDQIDKKSDNLKEEIIYDESQLQMVQSLTSLILWLW